MWMACVFQTSTSIHLHEFLPANVDKAWSGHHLNITLPLWQGFTDKKMQSTLEDAIGGRASFQLLLFSPDLSIRRWAESTRQSFNDIRNSLDPIIRKYYEDLHRNKRLLARKAWEKKKLWNLKKYLSGAKAAVQVTHGGEHTENICGSFRFTVSSRLGLGLKKGGWSIYAIPSKRQPTREGLRGNSTANWSSKPAWGFNQRLWPPWALSCLAFNKGSS